jgi:hypothetical protein
MFARDRHENARRVQRHELDRSRVLCWPAAVVRLDVIPVAPSRRHKVTVRSPASQTALEQIWRRFSPAQLSEASVLHGQCLSVSFTKTRRFAASAFIGFRQGTPPGSGCCRSKAFKADQNDWNCQKMPKRRWGKLPTVAWRPASNPAVTVVEIVPWWLRLQHPRNGTRRATTT